MKADDMVVVDLEGNIVECFAGINPDYTPAVLVNNYGPLKVKS